MKNPFISGLIGAVLGAGLSACSLIPLDNSVFSYLDPELTLAADPTAPSTLRVYAATGVPEDPLPRLQARLGNLELGSQAAVYEFYYQAVYVWEGLDLSRLPSEGAVLSLEFEDGWFGRKRALYQLPGRGTGFAWQTEPEALAAWVDTGEAQPGLDLNWQGPSSADPLKTTYRLDYLGQSGGGDWLTGSYTRLVVFPVDAFYAELPLTSLIPWALIETAPGTWDRAFGDSDGELSPAQVRIQGPDLAASGGL